MPIFLTHFQHLNFVQKVCSCFFDPVSFLGIPPEFYHLEKQVICFTKWTNFCLYILKLFVRRTTLLLLYAVVGKMFFLIYAGSAFPHTTA